MMQKYIRHTTSKLRLSRLRSGIVTSRAAGPAVMICSSSFETEGCVAGSSRNQRHQNTHQSAPTTPKIQNAARQPKRLITPATSGGATAPPTRLPRNTTPWANPRSGSGNQREKLREIFGNAPASPAPKRNRVATSEPRFQANPVAVVKNDHHST